MFPQVGGGVSAVAAYYLTVVLRRRGVMATTSTAFRLNGREWL